MKSTKITTNCFNLTIKALRKQKLSPIVTCIWGAWTRIWIWISTNN